MQEEKVNFSLLHPLSPTPQGLLTVHTNFKTTNIQGAKKIIFTACHSGKLKLAFTSPDIISTSPKNVLTSRIDFIVLLLFEFLKKHHLPITQVKNRITRPIAKSTSPGLLDTTFFAH